MFQNQSRVLKKDFYFQMCGCLNLLHFQVKFKPLPNNTLYLNYNKKAETVFIKTLQEQLWSYFLNLFYSCA